MEFDENLCVEALRQALKNENRAGAQTYSDDELLNIVDMIWDYYESRGMLELTMEDDEDELPQGEDLISELLTYVGKMLRRDKHATVSPDDIETLIRAELAYEESIEEDF